MTFRAAALTVTRLTAEFVTESGKSVAHISARGGEAVIAPPPLMLPVGAYAVNLELTLVGPAGQRATRHLERSVTLDGSMAELRL